MRDRTREILRRRKLGESYRQIGETFNISKQAVWMICHPEVKRFLRTSEKNYRKYINSQKI